jgi:hypothetical protein
MDSFDDGPSPQPDVTEAEMFVFLSNNNTNETLLMRPVLHSILQQHDEMKQIFTHTLVSAYQGHQERH